MKNGVYVVHFRTAMAIGAGVVTIRDNVATGGDAGYVYTGRIEDDGGKLSGNIAVQQHTAGNTSVFGNVSQFSLPLTGAMTGDHGKLTGQAFNQQIQVELKLFHEHV